MSAESIHAPTRIRHPPKTVAQAHRPATHEEEAPLRYHLGILQVGAVLIAFFWMAFVLPFLPGPFRYSKFVQDAYSAANLAVMLLATLLVLAVVALGLAAIFIPGKRPALRFYLGSTIAAGALLFLGFGNVEMAARASARDRAMHRAQPLIDALGKYAESRGAFPETLNDLLSTGLPRVPDAGCLGCGGYSYRRADGEYVLSFQLPFGVTQREVSMYRPSGKYKGEGRMPKVRRAGDWGYFVLYD